MAARYVGLGPAERSPLHLGRDPPRHLASTAQEAVKGSDDGSVVLFPLHFSRFLFGASYVEKFVEGQFCLGLVPRACR